MALRQRVEEVQAEALKESNASALALLREKQRREEVELQRDFLSRAEKRLGEQIGEVRGRLEEEHKGRLEERQQAADRLEALHDEIEAEMKQYGKMPKRHHLDRKQPGPQDECGRAVGAVGGASHGPAGGCACLVLYMGCIARIRS